MHFTRDLEEHPPLEWHDEIDQTLIPGGIFKEFGFSTKASGTLILADTIMNLELDKIDEPWRTATKLTGMYHPNGQIFFGMRLPILLQRKKARAAFRKLRAWDPQRIVLSHGHCFDWKRRQGCSPFLVEPAGALRAVVALTHGYAKEFGPSGITVNAVAPGVIETDMTTGIIAERGDSIRSMTPLGRIGQPDDIAGIVAFLASDDAGWITGRTIIADGGYN